MNDSKTILIILCCVLVGGIILFLIYRHQFQKMKLDNLVLIDGGVGAGKTSLSVILAIKTFKRNLNRWRICRYVLYFLPPFCWLKKVKNIRNIEKPVLYSNIPLRYVAYTPLTKDIIERKVRVPNKSVAFFSEMSLVIDSQAIRDPLLNERSSLCFKLWRHYTHGGSAFIETQSISDNHYSVKRSISRYYYIHSCIKKIPFILVYRLREMTYSDDGSVINVSSDSAVQEQRLLICFKKYWKYYDTYAYSGLTDELPYYIDNRQLSKNDSLKAVDIVSFRKFLSLSVNSKGGVNSVDKKN